MLKELEHKKCCISHLNKLLDKDFVNTAVDVAL